MGPVITINSATLVNKGLEVIEAHLLFGIPFDRIEVVVHPTVGRALDGRVRRRLHAAPGQPADDADPDRARPRLARPGARRRAGGRLDAGRRPGSSSRSTTRRSRRCGWPARRGSAGGTAPAVYNAANEVCVEAFLAGRLPFTEIVATVAAVLRAPRRTLEGSSSPSTTSSPPTPGPAARPHALITEGKPSA